MTVPPSALGALDPDAPLPFGRNSLVRAAVAEPATALLVQRALVMEVAHPKVAAAVAHHSHFQRRPLTRAWVTVDTALRLVFGDERTARGAARQIYGVHDHIHGYVEPSDGLWPEDEAYTAHDASLLAWVWATLVDTTEMAFTRWVRPFDATEADTFYREMRSFARFLGIPDHFLPADRNAFACYLEDKLAGDALGTTEESRSVARQVLWFDHRIVPSPLVRVERALALATLDPRIVDRLQIRPARGDAELARRLDAWLRAYYGRVPRLPRVTPSLYVLMRRPGIGLVGRARSALAQVWP